MSATDFKSPAHMNGPPDETNFSATELDEQANTKKTGTVAIDRDLLQAALTPQAIVDKVSCYIIGQNKALRVIAIVFRNRIRRMLLSPELRKEVTPKNVVIIGSTGSGKSETIRRTSEIIGCPFLKVEATKFTEVGYIGRDVDSIIRDLVDSAFKILRETEIAKQEPYVREIAENKILDCLLCPSRTTDNSMTSTLKQSEHSQARHAFRKRLRAGYLDETEIEIELAVAPVGVEIMGPPGMEEMTNQLQSMLQNVGSSRTRSRRMKIKEAIKAVQKEEVLKLLNEEELKQRAIEWVEQYGVVFIDEIDKVCRRGEITSSDVSREGVQRDLLPLIEGCTISTKYGMVRTHHILFIAAGAFHLAKPSDLIPELQGRLPVRVEFEALTIKDFERILVERHASLITQYEALLKTEGINLTFTTEAIKRIAELAYLVNEKVENIGARRLYTVMERLLEDISFSANNVPEKTINIDVDYVNKQLAALIENEEASHYIL